MAIAAKSLPIVEDFGRAIYSNGSYDGLMLNGYEHYRVSHNEFAKIILTVLNHFGLLLKGVWPRSIKSAMA